MIDTSFERTVYLVACCGPKRPEQSPAADMYISDLFIKSRTYVERRGPWYILSALHGLIAPTTIIVPYDVTLKNLSASKRREWGIMVRTQLMSAGLIDVNLVALAGNDYVNPLISAGLILSRPMKGLGIGQQLQWLKKQNGTL